MSSRFASGNISAGEREDRGNRWVLAAFGVIRMAIGFFRAYTDRLGVCTLDGDAIRWAGLVVYVAGCILRIFPVYVLGNRFRGLVAIQPGHISVTTGICCRIRHPSHLGMLVIVLGWALAFGSVVGLLLGSALVPLLISRHERPGKTFVEPVQCRVGSLPQMHLPLYPSCVLIKGENAN